MLEKISVWADKGAEFLGISAAIASISLILSARGRATWKYAASSVIAGTVVGLVVWGTPMITDWSYLAAALAAISGPATLMAWQNKTIPEVLDELKSAAKDLERKPADEDHYDE